MKSPEVGGNQEAAWKPKESRRIEAVPGQSKQLADLQVGDTFRITVLGTDGARVEKEVLIQSREPIGQIVVLGGETTANKKQIKIEVAKGVPPILFF